MEGEARVGRILKCGWCGILVVLCRECDYGNKYCSENCSKKARKRTLKAAGARYQSSFEGARKHAARQAAYEQRRAEKLTQQSFQGEKSPAIVGQVEQASQAPAIELEMPKTPLQCNSCGLRCVFVVRRWTRRHLRRRPHRRQGEKYDGGQRSRSRDLEVISC